MTSRTITMAACWVLMILHWTTDMFPGGVVPMAFCASFLIMEWTGMFRREEVSKGAHITKDGEIDDGLSKRQLDFINKMKQGKKESYQPTDDKSAVIVMVDQEGNESSVIIKDDGTIETTGDPNPDIIEAVKMLQSSIIEYGPEAIAEELGKQIDKINRGEQ